MRCEICGTRKQCQRCKGSGKEPMPPISQVPYGPKCSHCHGTRECPSYKGK